MHDIWNPWHGCVRISEGCDHCYMYYLDGRRGQDGSRIYRTSGFDYPLRKTRSGHFQVQSGETLRVCMTSDFFLAEADAWRDEAFRIMRERSDVVFYLLTKRPERVESHLPADWGVGYPNVFFNVTCENQRRADERMPILLSLPFLHKGVMCAPLVGEVSLAKWLDSGKVEGVTCGGENYDGARPCHHEWVQRLHRECAQRDIRFNFIETGTVFVKNGKTYRMEDKRLQAKMAYRSGLHHIGKPIQFELRTGFLPVENDMLHAPRFREGCYECGGRLTCNGCGNCGKCNDAFIDITRTTGFDAFTSPHGSPCR